MNGWILSQCTWELVKRGRPSVTEPVEPLEYSKCQVSFGPAQARRAALEQADQVQD